MYSDNVHDLSGEPSRVVRSAASESITLLPKVAHTPIRFLVFGIFDSLLDIEDLSNMANIHI